MPAYRARVLTDQGKLLTQTIDAPSVEALTVRLRQAGHYPLALRALAPRRLHLPHRLTARRAPHPDLAMLLRELATLLDDGVEISRGIEILARLTPQPALAASLDRARAEVRGGARLHDAMHLAGLGLSDMILAMIKVGEHAGALGPMLCAASDHLARAQAFARRLHAALIYPAMVLVTGTVSLGFVTLVVLPGFAPIFAQAGLSLPWPTRLMMAASDAALRFGWIAPLGMALTLFALRRRRSALHRRLLRLPVVGPLLALTDAARFCRALGAVSAAGMELPAGLALTARTLANQAIATTIDDAIPRLRAGEALGDIIAAADIFPPLVAQMLRLGDENGRLDVMASRAADLLEAELERRLDRLQALLVPGLTIGLGGLVALIVGSVMLALLQLNQLAN